jgi:hypothetical protein
MLYEFVAPLGFVADKLAAVVTMSSTNGQACGAMVVPGHGPVSIDNGLGSVTIPVTAYPVSTASSAKLSPNAGAAVTVLLTLTGTFAAINGAYPVPELWSGSLQWSGRVTSGSAHQLVAEMTRAKMTVTLGQYLVFLRDICGLSGGDLSVTIAQ